MNALFYFNCNFVLISLRFYPTSQIEVWSNPSLKYQSKELMPTLFVKDGAYGRTHIYIVVRNSSKLDFCLF